MQAQAQAPGGPGPGFQWIAFSKGQFLSPQPLGWGLLQFVAVPNRITWRESAQLAEERLATDLECDFQHPGAIRAFANGGQVPPHLVPYVYHALKGGGYRSQTAAALFHLRHGNLLNRNLLYGISNNNTRFAVDSLIIHYCTGVRIIKNLDVFAYNCLRYPFAFGNYETMRDKIHNSFRRSSRTPPQSATVLSATRF